MFRWETPIFDCIPNRNRESYQHQTWQNWLPTWEIRVCKISSRSVQKWLPHVRVKYNVSVYVCMYVCMYGFIFPSESPQPKPLIRFERTIRQKMRLGARMCPFSKCFSSFSCLRGAFVQNPHYFQAGIGKPSQTQKCYYFKNFWFNLYAERLERRTSRPESCFLIWLFQSFHVLEVIFHE